MNSNESGDGMGFWGGLILGGFAGAVLLGMARRGQPAAPQRPPAPALPPPQQLGPPSGAPMNGMGVMNGIPTVPLPQESARRTSQLRTSRPPSHPSQLMNPGGVSGSPQQAHQSYEETFGGVEGGLGGENF